MSKDAAAFLRAHPDLEFVDLLMPDLNAILRGKKVSARHAAESFSKGVLLPRSIYGTDVRGDTVDETDMGMTSGDRDYPCMPVVETLRVTPWARGAQCMIEMHDEHGAPFACGPREILRRATQSLRAAGLHPTVAVELEFYLFQGELAGGRPRFLIDPVSGGEIRSTQVYSMSDLEAQEPFIETVRRYCVAQSVPASAAIAEYAPGQFEVNLHHGDDPVQACDDAMYLKRIIRIAAREHGMLATFMAKPVEGITGSGMHLHVSLCDDQGANRFAAGPELLQQAIAGLQQTMGQAMLLLAPHANSYRRYGPGFYVPMSPTWGFNNRTVALRIPAGPDSARRIEHRVAGADANPYLVMAAVLAGILHGVQQRLTPDEPIADNAENYDRPRLPLDWWQAIGTFAASDWVRQGLGEQFAWLFTLIKQAEYRDYQSHIPPQDIEWYLQTL